MSETIKMTNEQITNTVVTYISGQAMSNPAQESLKKKKLPVKIQYWIRRVLDKITQNFKILEETRQELVQQHAKKDEDGKIVSADDKGSVTIENVTNFQKALNDLMQVEVDLGINKIEVDFEAWERNPNIDMLDGSEMDLLLPMLEIKNDG